ncbi:MAG TPA: porin [bacterium]|nr:porin [bacterium]
MSRPRVCAAILSFSLICMTASFPAAGAEEKPSPPPRSGIEMGTMPAVISSPGVRLEIHSSIHIDYVGFDDGEQYIKDVGSQENNIFERRARIQLRAKLWDRIGFYMQGAFDVAQTPILDAMVMIPFTPWLDLNAGLMKMPFSEERLASYASGQPFMERSLAANLELRRSQGASLVFHPGAGAVNVYLGCYTGEPIVTPNTDDDFEYVGRVVLRFDSMFDDFPGAADMAVSYARGRRAPERDLTKSFGGKTMNELAFFAPIPVDGYRTRWEGDAEWRYRSLWVGGEIISSREERDGVTVDLRTGGADKATGRDLEPLEELGWNAFLVWVITGENAEANLQPSRDWGALELAARYGVVSYQTGEKWIMGDTAVPGREVSLASAALGRPSVNETAHDLYLGLNWFLKPGVFFQTAAIWQWFDASSPYVDRHDTSDINYRARVGVAF